MKLALSLALVMLAATGATVHDSLYLTRGRMVDIGGRRLNMYCIGKGSPTVVFDSGLEDWAPAWDTVQPVIAKTTRACTYDRAGNGFSDPGPMPRTSMRIVADLHALLTKAGEKPPFVLVGHSFGGINVRLYADRYPKQVAGLVLVDASAEQQVRYMSAKQRRENDAQILHAQQMLEHCRELAVLRFRTATAKQLRECPGTFFRGLPDPKDFPGPLDRTLIYEAEQPKQYAASASELSNFTTAGMRALLPYQRNYGAMPLRILVAYHHVGMSPADERLWRRMHRQWLRLSTNARYIAARRSGHYIQFDQPNLVIDAILDEIRIVRRVDRPQGCSD